MKQLFFFILTTVFLISCDDTATKNQPNISTLSKKDSLINDVKKYPDSLLLIESLIEFYRENNQYDSALIMVDQLLKKDSSVAKFWDMKGILYFENNDTINAIISYERAIEIYPDPGYIMSLGAMYAETKNPKALEMADALIIGDKATANKEALFIKGLYYSYTNNKQKAIEFFDQAINMDYTFMFGYREKAIALYDLGKYDEALKTLDRAVTLKNDFDEGYYWRGRCLEKQHKIKEAIDEYKTALYCNANFIEAQDALARLNIR